MAEVTGFTADRMRIIENETVVDGEVQGDNLILQTREGTPIDAGNVRGPQGIQGVAGPVQSVNNQLGSVFTPRIFANKAALDAWTTAPDGTDAFTTTEGTTWQRIGGAWQANPGPRIYATQSALITNWNNAPVGSQAATIDSHSTWYKDSIGWITNNGLRVFASAAERDQHWPNPPNGSVCLAPSPVEWTYGGSWFLTNTIGYVAHSERGSAAGPVGYLPAVNISGLGVSCNFPAAKWVEISFSMRHWRFYSHNADYATVEIRNESGVTIQDAVSPATTIAGGAIISGPVYMSRIWLCQPGPHSWSIWAASQVSGGSAELTAYPHAPMTLSLKAL